MMQTDIPHVTLTTYSQEGVDLAKALTRIEKLEAAIKEHNDECNRQCGVGKNFDYRCGARMCANCPAYYKIEMPE